MECGIFDFYKVFSRAFGEDDGVEESKSGRSTTSDQQFPLWL